VDKEYRSAVMAAINETATDLYSVGGMDRDAMRKFDRLCVTTPNLSLHAPRSAQDNRAVAGDGPCGRHRSPGQFPGRLH